MKMRLKKKYLGLLLVSFILIISLFTRKADLKLRTFIIEKPASLLIPVRSEAYGAALKTAFEAAYPMVTLNFKLVAPSSNEGIIEEDFDLFFGPLEQIALYAERFLPLEKNFKSFNEFLNIRHFNTVINHQATIVVLSQVAGWALIVNEPALTAAGLTEDFSWEDILALTELVDVDELVALAFNDIYSLYSFLTVAGWDIYPLNQATIPNFADEKFLFALEFLAQLGEKQATDKLINWHYEQVLFEESSLISLAGSWPIHQAYLPETYQVWPSFPCYHGYRGSQLVEVYGYGINKATKYPNAAKMLLQFMHLPANRQLMLDDELIFPLIPTNWWSELTVSPKKKAWITALTNGQTSPLMALTQNPSKKASDVLEEIDLLTVLLDVYQQRLSPSQAQQLLVEWALDWIKQYDYSDQ